MTACLRLLTALLVCSACMTSDETLQVSHPECVVVALGGETVTMRHVESLRALARPAPGGDVAKRWAIDVALARWAYAGRIGDSPVSAWLGSYRALLAELPAASDRERWRARASVKAKLREGACAPTLLDVGS
jgi:hypothetical protein